MVERLVVSVQQANILRDSLEAAKKPYQFVLYPDNGHLLPVADVKKDYSLSERKLRIRLPD